MNLADGSIEPLVGEASKGIAVAADELYWISAFNAIRRRSLTTGDVETVASDAGGFSALASNGRQLAWAMASPAKIVTLAGRAGVPLPLVETTESVSDLQLSATDVYWITGQTIQKIPLAGGQLTTLATKQVEPFALTQDDNVVYWLTSGRDVGMLMRKAPADSTPKAILKELSLPSSGLAIDAGFAYFVDGGDLIKADLATGATSALATNVSSTANIGLGVTHGVVTDQRSLYCSNDTGGILKITPK